MKGGRTVTLVLVLSALAVYESVGGEYRNIEVCLAIGVSLSLPPNSKQRARSKGRACKVAVRHTLC